MPMFCIIIKHYNRNHTIFLVLLIKLYEIGLVHLFKYYTTKDVVDHTNIRQKTSIVITKKATNQN